VAGALAKGSCSVFVLERRKCGMNVVFPHEARIDPADGASVSRGVCFTKREWQTEIAPV
jgi:hypothetical protein